MLQKWLFGYLFLKFGFVLEWDEAPFRRRKASTHSRKNPDYQMDVIQHNKNLHYPVIFCCFSEDFFTRGSLPSWTFKGWFCSAKSWFVKGKFTLRCISDTTQSGTGTIKTVVENLTKNPLEKGFNPKRFSSFLSEKANLLRSEEGLDYKKIGLSL